MTTLVIATRNTHKTGEIRAILGRKFGYLTLDDFPTAPAVVEDGKTFAENAAIKSVSLAAWLARNTRQWIEKVRELGKLFVLADDSGLEVDALAGAPGVHSARFAALDSGVPGNSPDTANNAKLLRLLQSVPREQRTGRFRCTLALTQIPFATLTKRPLVSTPDGLSRYTKIFEGVCEGGISFDPSGKDGFGYDPLFVPKGYTESFARLGEEEKNKISHRAKALELLRKHLLAM